MACLVMMRCLLDVLTPLSLLTKRRSSFEMRVVILIGGGLVQEILTQGERVYEGYSDDFCIFSFPFILDTLSLVHWYCDHLVITHLVLMLIYIEVVITFFHLYLHALFLFSLYTHVSYFLYAIYYFYFTLRYCDEFCLKCFRNTGCQSLFAMNSLLAKFFKSLCQDRFYCIQQVNMS